VRRAQEDRHRHSGHRGARRRAVRPAVGFPRDVTTLAGEIGQSVAAGSRHLATLKPAGVVRVRRAGRRSIDLVADPHLAELVQLSVCHRDKPDAPVARPESCGA
jgi:hypothetical protein